MMGDFLIDFPVPFPSIESGFNPPIVLVYRPSVLLIDFSSGISSFSPDSFLSHGLDILRVILKSGWPDAVLRVISVVVPLFVKCSEMLSSSPGLVLFFIYNFINHAELSLD